jgi:putative PIN family toxin of toxin-antitoxin system
VRLVIDTNVLISALLGGPSLPAHLIALWREGDFRLVTSAEQMSELMRVTRYPKIRERLVPAIAGRLLKTFATGRCLWTPRPALRSAPIHSTIICLRLLWRALPISS